MKNDEELVADFWHKLRRADLDQSKLAYGFETRVLANLRSARQPLRLSLLQLASRFCLVTFCALLLLGIYLPRQVEAYDLDNLAQVLTGANVDVSSLFNPNGNGDSQ